MLNNVLKVFLRKAAKQLGLLGFQLIGLVAGISTFLIVFSFYQFETSFDSHFSGYNRIFRIEKIEKKGDVSSHTTKGSRLIEELVKAEIPEVEVATSMINGSFDVTIVHYPENKAWNWLNSHWVSKGFFDVFDFELLEGNRESLFSDPNAVVITKTMADKIYGTESALGKVIFIWGKSRPISGVVADAPENSHMQFDFVTSTDHFFDNSRWDRSKLSSSWNYLNFVLNYVKLSDGADPSLVEEKINAIYSRYKEETDPERNFILIPVNDIHLHSKAEWQITDLGNPLFVRLVFYTGVIILLLTLINFVKISLASVTNRIKETGVRKVLGGSNYSLALAIIGENASIILLSILLSFGLVYSLGLLELSWLPLDIYVDFLTTPLSFSVLFTFFILGSVVPSVLPVQILFRLSIMNSLRGYISSGAQNFGLLKVLMSIQVLFSLMLITLTFFLKDQMNYILTKDTGYGKEHVLFMELHAENARFESLEAFKQYLRTIPGINSVTNSLQVPLKWAGRQNYKLKEQGGETEVIVSRSGVNHDFFQTLEIEIVEGREFSKEYSDSTSTILNESAVKRLGMQDPIGKQVVHTRGDRVETRTVVGVVKDFNFRSMYSPLLPAQFLWIPRGPIISVNFDSNRTDLILADIESHWNDFGLEGDFNYTFMDDYFAAQHKEDIMLKRTIAYLSTVIVFLASLGIFGMSAFIGQVRQKEIAIRKVLGSSEFQVFWMLTRSYVITVLVSLIISAYPIYLLVNQWLSNFAYAAHFNYLNFGTGVLIVLSIVLFISGINTVRAVTRDPIDTLSQE